MGIATVCGLFVAAESQAFMLGGLRLVYRQDQKAVEMPVFSGKGDKSYLVKTTLLADEHSQRTVSNFMISPPLFRLEPGGRNNLRISLINSTGLPPDRESVFYLNVSGIPSSSPLARGSREGFSGASLSFGTGNRIKFFYRPDGINAPTTQTYRSLVFSRTPGGVQVSNPTPYNITLATDLVEKRARKMVMIPPFGKQLLPSNASINRQQLTWFVINDSADVESGIAVIQ